jgi:FlaA1/EpsC-like NDP-sugar epimerase
MLNLTFKRRILEVVLDFVIIILAYYLAFVIRYGLNLNSLALQVFLSSLPYTLVATYLSFFYFGVYRGVWRYVGVADFVRYGKAVLGAVILTAGATFIIQIISGGAASEAYPLFAPEILLLFGLFLFLGLAFTRSSFKVLDSYSGLKSREADQRILIIGAGDSGEMALRWILMNPRLGYKPVGFLDADPFKSGRNIHGIPVLGGVELLEHLLDLHKIDGVILAEMNIKEQSLEQIETISDSYPATSLDQVVNTCQRYHCWVRSLKLDFELIE